MAKKKPKEIIEDIADNEVVISEEAEEGIVLLKEEKLELMYLDAVIKNLELSARLKEREFSEAIVALQKRITELQSQKAIELNSLVEEKRNQIAEMRQVKDKIEAKYSIRLSECSFDEFTGKITILPQ